MHSVIIIGSGPAGYTAAIYAARADLEPVLFTGLQMGGQLTITDKVENFPGFPEGILGPELMTLMKKQCERFGTRIITEQVTEVDFRNHPLTVKTAAGAYQAKTVIVATGASARKLGVKGESEFTGKGVSYCATCDAFFYRGRRVAVVGGGDSALEEASILAKVATSVHLIHRRDRFRSGPALQARVEAIDNIHPVMESVTEEILGNDEKGVTGIRLKHLPTGKISELEIDGLFGAIGHEPNTAVFKGHLDLDRAGYVKTDERQRTTARGVFAGGDVQDSVYQQAVTAAASGCMAALEADKFLAEMEDRVYPGDQP
ncbi:MAG: thioredoxin-disulfide reductase [Candidatus Eisenbacteria sp.]|nr:thioredoxin-disulfide reductase [Candidatus Eisenbacteria bacterium]